MSCGACVRHVTRALEGISGVVDVQVDLASATATLTVEPTRIRVEDLIRAVSVAGYSARQTDPATRDDPNDPYSRAGGCCRTRRGPTAAG